MGAGEFTEQTGTKRERRSPEHVNVIWTRWKYLLKRSRLKYLRVVAISRKQEVGCYVYGVLYVI